MGLRNRVVAEGTSRAAAEALAREEALVAEARGGLAATTSEAVAGAARFASVLGRHGAFDETQRRRSGLGLRGIG